MGLEPPRLDKEQQQEQQQEEKQQVQAFHRIAHVCCCWELVTFGFWASGSSRIGEPGARGWAYWCCWHAMGLEPPRQDEQQQQEEQQQEQQQVRAFHRFAHVCCCWELVTCGFWASGSSRIGEGARGWVCWCCWHAMGLQPPRQGKQQQEKEAAATEKHARVCVFVHFAVYHALQNVGGWWVDFCALCHKG
jgi:hypothetical protein